MLKGNGVLEKQPQPNQQPLQPGGEHLRWEKARGTAPLAVPLHGAQRAQGSVPGSSHHPGLRSLEHSTGILGALTRKGGSHHPRQPGLVHAVNHAVGLINDLQETGS